MNIPCSDSASGKWARQFVQSRRALRAVRAAARLVAFRPAAISLREIPIAARTFRRACAGKSEFADCVRLFLRQREPNYSPESLTVAHPTCRCDTPILRVRAVLPARAKNVQPRTSGPLQAPAQSGRTRKRHGERASHK